MRNAFWLPSINSLSIAAESRSWEVAKTETQGLTEIFGQSETSIDVLC